MSDAPTDADLASIGAAISEGIVLPHHRLVLGLQHRSDSGLRVCAWDGRLLRHMSPAKARRTARELLDADASLKPVADAMNKLADRCDELAKPPWVEIAPGLATMPAEGRA